MQGQHIQNLVHLIFFATIPVYLHSIHKPLGPNHLLPEQNIFGGTLYYCYENSYSKITNRLYIATFINKKGLQPAHIWITDHADHDRKNLIGSNLEKVLIILFPVNSSHLRKAE